MSPLWKALLSLGKDMGERDDETLMCVNALWAVLKGHQDNVPGEHSPSQNSSLSCVHVSKRFSALQEQLCLKTSNSSVTHHEGKMFATLPTSEAFGPALPFQSDSETDWIIFF